MQQDGPAQIVAAAVVRHLGHRPGGDGLPAGQVRLGPLLARRERPPRNVVGMFVRRGVGRDAGGQVFMHGDIVEVT